MAESTLFSSSAASTQAVEYVLDVIVSRGGDLLYDHYLKEREVPFAASRVLGTLARVVGAVYLQGDGEHGSDKSGELRTGMLGVEVVVVIVVVCWHVALSWRRGVVAPVHASTGAPPPLPTPSTNASTFPLCLPSCS